jgi:hypothetical protein
VRRFGFLLRLALVLLRAGTCLATADKPQLSPDQVIQIATREAERKDLDVQGYAPKLSYDSSVAIWTVDYVQKIDRPKRDAARFSIYVNDRTKKVIAESSFREAQKRNFQIELEASSIRERERRRVDNQHFQAFFQDDFEPIYRLRDIDPAVLAALRAKIGKRERFAERGQPFQLSDVPAPGDETLPLLRLVVAGHTRNKWFILYTRGGFVSSDVLVLFSRSDGHWKIEFTTGGKSGPENLSEFLQAVRSGHYLPGRHGAY